MRVKIYWNCWLLKFFPKIAAITLYPFILIRYRKDLAGSTTLRHEMVHVAQVRKLGWFKFYFLYVKYFFKAFFGEHFLDMDAAYSAIPYEREAYRLQNTPYSPEELQEIKGP